MDELLQTATPTGRFKRCYYFLLEQRNPYRFICLLKESGFVVNALAFSSVGV
jgi:hypothetical protein